MNAICYLVTFDLDQRRFALPLQAVQTIVRAVEVMPLPGAPKSMAGVINFRGAILPVIKLRERCGLPDRDIKLTDQMIIAHSSKRQIAMLVDASEVMECPSESVVPATQVFDDLHFVRDLVKHPDGTLVPLFDPDTFLSLEELTAAEAALANVTGAVS